LNYLPRLAYDAIAEVERHLLTDEVFALIDGHAALVDAREIDGRMHFTVEAMVPGTVYNVPAGTWHTIALGDDARVLIVEADGTDRHDVTLKPLRDEERRCLSRLLVPLAPSRRTP
jgi:mannose-6-phosphate isomerase-like protein (cupin superfamily)